MESKVQDLRVKAIRNDPKVGRGSLSDIDECFSDQELIKLLNEEKRGTVPRAVAYVRSLQRLWNNVP